MRYSCHLAGRTTEVPGRVRADHNLCLGRQFGYTFLCLALPCPWTSSRTRSCLSARLHLCNCSWWAPPCQWFHPPALMDKKSERPAPASCPQSAPACSWAKTCLPFLVVWPSTYTQRAQLRIQVHTKTSFLHDLIPVIREPWDHLKSSLRSGPKTILPVRSEVSPLNPMSNDSHAHCLYSIQTHCDKPGIPLLILCHFWPYFKIWSKYLHFPKSYPTPQDHICLLSGTAIHSPQKIVMDNPLCTPCEELRMPTNDQSRNCHTKNRFCVFSLFRVFPHPSS